MYIQPVSRLSHLSLLVALTWSANSLAEPAETSRFPVSQQWHSQTISRASGGQVSSSSHSIAALPSLVWDDLQGVLSDPEFCIIAGGLTIAPLLFQSLIREESAELTERWGPSPAADRFFEAGELMGEGAVQVGLSLSALTLGELTQSYRWNSFGSDLMRAQALNGIVTTGMKRVVNRTRPDGSAHAYPSGHTSAAFATATVVHRHFGPIWGGVAIASASFVGLSRLQENKHYLTDVIAGAILGGYLGYSVARSNSSERHVVLAPQVVGNGMGMSISVRW